MVSLLWARGGETRFSNSLTPHFSFTYAELSMHASRAVSPSTDVREPRHHHLRLEYALPTHPHLRTTGGMGRRRDDSGALGPSHHRWLGVHHGETAAFMLGKGGVSVPPRADTGAILVGHQRQDAAGESGET